MTAQETAAMRSRREVATAARPHVWIYDQVEDEERQRLTEQVREALSHIPAIKAVTLNLR